MMVRRVGVREGGRVVGARVAAEVTALLAREEITWIERQLTGYDCPVCKQSGTPADGAASVVVYQSAVDDARVVRLAHAACSASRVIEVGPAAAFPDHGLWWARAAVAGYGNGWLPIIVAEPVTGPSAPAAGGDRVDLAMAYLLGKGMHMIAGSLPGEAFGWGVSIGQDVVRIDAPGGDLFYHGPLHLPVGWREHSDALVSDPPKLGGTVLYAGTGLGMGQWGTELDPVIEAMDRSAHAGLLAGCLAPVRFLDLAELPQLRL